LVTRCASGITCVDKRIEHAQQAKVGVGQVGSAHRQSNMCTLAFSSKNSSYPVYRTGAQLLEKNFG
jgi:hypothetical protein